MKNHSDTYKTEVYKFLENGTYGSTYLINDWVKVENQPRFIEIVKQYMNETAYQGGWEFNADYTRLRRIDLDFSKKQDNSKKLKQYR